MNSQFRMLQDSVEHDNPADYYNTVIKIAKKRAFVDAILTTTAASDIFAEDVEETEEISPEKIAENLINDCSSLEQLETLWNKINSLTKKRKQVLSKSVNDNKAEGKLFDENASTNE